jgi:hypothetical protein
VARTFVAASSQYLDNTGGAPTATVAVSFSAWIKPVAQAGAVRYVCSQSKSSSGAEITLRLEADGTVSAIMYDGSAFGSAQTTAKVTAGAWNHVCGVFATTGSRSVYLAGANKVTNTTAVAGAMNTNQIDVGAYYSGPAFFFDGDIGEVTVWSVALTDAEVALLATGALPTTLQRTSLAFHAPIGGVYAPEPDQIGSLSLTVHGATASAAFPPLAWPGGFSGAVKFPSPILSPARAMSFTQSIDLARFFPPVPPPITSYGWPWPKPIFPKSGHATRGGFIKQTDPWAVPDFSSALIYITVNGIARGYGLDISGGFIESGSLSIQDVLNQTPNTCQFIAKGFTPIVGQRVVMALGGIDNPSRLFAGSILSVAPIVSKTWANQSFSVSCIDDTWLLNKVKVIKTYTSQSATDIAIDLLRTYAPGFTWRHVQPGLDTIDLITFTNEDLTTCFNRLARRIGVDWKTDDFDDFWFGTTGDGVTPVELTSTHPTLSEFASSTTISDIITRCLVEGGGVNALAAVAVGDTILPLDLVAVNGVVPWYNALGGTVVCGTQRLTYTGVQVGGAGSLVGPGIGPTVAPTLAVAAGAGIESGVHGYGVTFVTAAGESLPSAVGTVTTGAIAAPSAAPIAGVPSSGGSITAGDHYYAVTLVTASGETTPSAVSATETAADGVSDPSAQIAFWFSSGGGSGGPLGNGTYQWGYTFVTAAGETTLGSSIFPVTAISAGAQVYPTIPAGPAGTTARRYYRTAANGATLKLVAEIAGNVSTNYTDSTPDAALGVAAPSSNTTNRQTIALFAIQTGPAVVTARKLYRTAAGGSQLKLLATIADNVTTTYSDTLADASLGANAPSSNTATANQVSVSTIQIYSGSGTVTARKLYRTVAGGSQLKLLTTIADNITTTYTDSTADASLGANVPSSDTSTLPQGSGSVLAGSSTLLVAGVSWASSAGGWAVIGNGQQVIRYTGYSGNTLTGIPTSGIGAITAPANYNSTVSAAPCLTGIPASSTGSILYAINKGDPVNLLVQVDDTDAQAILSALLDPSNLLAGAAGIREDYLQDNRISETEARARGTAQLALMSRAQVSVTYKVQDPLTVSGRTVTIDLPSPQSLSTSLTIQRVTISNFKAASTFFPDYHVEASSVRMSFDDLVRLFRSQLNG